MNRHLSVQDAIDSVSEYVAIRRTIDDGNCDDTWRACDEQAHDDYETGLAVVDAQRPFFSLPGGAAGGAAGGGLGALIGWIGGPPGSAIGGSIGGSLGALGGGLV